MMHRGCGRAVRTWRTFCDDRAAPTAPDLYFLCAKQMTPIIWGLLLVLLADSECAFCAGCQLRLRMARSGMMHRGCGRPVRTSRTFSYDDRAAPIGPVVYFLCAKEMTPIIWPAFGAPLLIRIALSALDASCDCACYDQA